MAGNITIIVPTDNFVKVPKGIVSNDAVDTLALGIFVKVLCMGLERSLTIQDFADRLGVSLAKVQKAFAALEGAGYLRRTRSKGPDGRFVGWDYEISSEPLTECPKNRQSEKPTIGKTDCRKIGVSVPKSHIIINKDNIVTGSITNTTGIDSNTPVDTCNISSPTINTVKRKEKKNSQKRNEKKTTHFRKPTIQEIEDYCRERQNDVDAVAFFNFYESKGWMVGRNPMKDWKAAVITWETRHGQHRPKSTPKQSQPLGDYYTDLIQSMREYYGTDTPDEQ